MSDKTPMTTGKTTPSDKRTSGFEKKLSDLAKSDGQRLQYLSSSIDLLLNELARPDPGDLPQML
jgi:hypothetical protein